MYSKESFKENYLPIKELIQIPQDEGYFANNYYFSKEMMNNGIFILESMSLNPDVEHHFIFVKILQRNDAEEFSLYSGQYLDNIQVFSILKDIVTLFKENTFEEFREILHLLCHQYSSASMQRDLCAIQEHMSEMKSEFEFIKSMSE